MNRLLVTHALSTYFMRIAADIPELGLQAGDVVLVDRSLRPKKTDLVVVAETEDPELKIIRFKDTKKELELWGVVEHVIRKVKT